MSTPKTPRVLTVSPMPPEKSAYALARYSRSPHSIRDSIEWVRTHDSAKFLESFYFQYGHASIADLGHVIVCFEGVSELAATEIEDETLWDGQARSSRYQDFSRSGFIVPPEISDASLYSAAASRLLAAYGEIHARMCEYLSERLPRPAEMKPEVYQRNISARAFDVARYVLFFGIPTGVGQVTSIRTLERQIRRLKGSEYAEVRELGDELALACASPPACVWDPSSAGEPLAPTLARHVEPDQHAGQSRRDIERWARQNLPPASKSSTEPVQAVRPMDNHADLVATLLYPVTDHSFAELYELACSWTSTLRNEVIDAALKSRTRRDELQRAFRQAPYAFDIVMDIGAYRDLHRHRRCHQFRKTYNGKLGYDTPDGLVEAGLQLKYDEAMRETFATMAQLPPGGSDYLLPFGARSRFLFKMDFAEAEYIIRLRSGVKGHFSYRKIAWEMKQALEKIEPELSCLIEATPPWVEDPLKR